LRLLPTDWPASDPVDHTHCNIVAGERWWNDPADAVPEKLLQIARIPLMQDMPRQLGKIKM
jgi:hypothetical protein